MISFWRIFWLEAVSLIRSKTLALLTVAGVVWILAAPYVIRGDGTGGGARELYLQYALGGVFALLVMALLASATGAIASERTAKRLQLTMVRPVRYFVIALAKIAAIVSVGAVVLAVASLLVLVRADRSVRCSHVLSPILPTPREEALSRYESFMKDPETPTRVKKARKEDVLRILVQWAVDYYETIPTNGVVAWTFASGGDAVRLRFSTRFDTRQDLRGTFWLNDRRGSVSNVTQSVLTVPLASGTGAAPGAANELRFRNEGSHPLMLRPRRDLNVLIVGDSFAWNLWRAYLVMVAVLALVVSAGMLLSAALGRPVAVFVAFSILLVSEMSPSVVDQYPDELSAGPLDRIGLEITRAAARLTRPVSDLSPLGALSRDECVEWADVWRALALDLVAIPIVLSLLAGFVLPRKQEDV